MTRGKASTSAWGRPGSPQLPIGTTRSRTCAARPVLRGRPRLVATLAQRHCTWTTQRGLTGRARHLPPVLAAIAFALARIVNSRHSSHHDEGRLLGVQMDQGQSGRGLIDRQ